MKNIGDRGGDKGKSADHRTSITRRLTLTLTGSLIVFWMLAIGLSILVMRHELDETFDSSLQETTERLMVLIIDDIQLRRQLDPAALTEVRMTNNREYLTYQVRQPDGTIVFRSADAQKEPFAVPLKVGFGDTQRHRIYTVGNSDGTLFLQVADRFGNRREAVRESAVTMLIPLAILIPVSIFAIWFIVGRTLRPIEKLRQEISIKDGGNMAPVESWMLPKELKPIARSVNLLLERLRTAFEAEREFTSNSAHELRTPIAGALAQTQRLLEELPDGAWKNRAKNVETALSNLSHLAEKLLQLARADSGIGKNTVPVDLTTVLDVVVSDFQRNPATGDRLRYERAADTPVTRRADIDAFGIVMRNLLDNAAAHGDANGDIEVLVSENGAIRVINEAEVIDAADLETMKKRFHRGKTTASGSGLGLAIVEKLVREMGGELTLRSPARGRATGFEAEVILRA